MHEQSSCVWLNPTALTVGVVLAFGLLFFDIYEVQSNSMKHVAPKGSYVVVSRYHYTLFDTKPGDIAAFRPVSKVFETGIWTHRIIGTPGDHISTKNNLLIVNGNPAPFPHIKRDRRVFTSTTTELVVPPGHVFQKGDTAATLYGLIDASSLVGKVIMVIK